jgi:hypothetical protein
MFHTSLNMGQVQETSEKRMGLRAEKEIQSDYSTEHKAERSFETKEVKSWYMK